MSLPDRPHDPDPHDADPHDADPHDADPHDADPPARPRTPLYAGLLRLQHVHPNAWQRAVLGEGALAVGVLLALADLATAWTIVVLPVAVAAVVKAHDLLQGRLDARS